MGSDGKAVYARRAASAAFCMLALAAGWPAPAAAEERPPVSAQAKARLDNGLRLYEAHQFAAAAAEFEATYALDPHRDVLYVWAQALRLGGQCAKALPLYQQFLDAAPPRAEAERARANLTRCRADLAAAPAPPPAGATSAAPAATGADHPPDPGQAPPPPAGSVVTVPAAHPPDTGLTSAPPPSRPPRRLDTVDRVLLGGGGLALAASGGLYLSARAERDDAQRAVTYSEVEQHADAAHSRDRLAWAALAIGVGIIAAAVIRLAWR